MSDFASFDVPLWVWAALVAAISAMLVIDLLLVHRTAHVISAKEATIESAIWISIGLAFGLIILAWQGGHAAGEYYAGFLIEKSLSVDNVFVWAVIFSFFAIPREFQFRVLFWGIFGALVLRAIFIFAGVSLIERFEWILYIFGVFLLYTAFRIATHDETQQVDYDRNLVMRMVRRVVPSTSQFDGQRLFTVVNAKRVGHAAVHGARADRGHRRRVRRRLGAGDPGGEPGDVRRLRLERVRHPRPAVALLPPRRHAGPLPLPQHRAWRDPRLRRREDAAPR